MSWGLPGEGKRREWVRTGGREQGIQGPDRNPHVWNGGREGEGCLTGGQQIQLAQLQGCPLEG